MAGAAGGGAGHRRGRAAVRPARDHDHRHHAGEGKEFPPAKQLAADAVGTAGWVGATALLTAAADRLRVPPAVTAVLLGAAVYAGDLKGRALAEQARAAVDQARAQPDDTPEAQPAP